MSETKWRAVTSKYQPPGYPYAVISDGDGSKPNDVIAPNVDTEEHARLIAAAPRLYSALEELRFRTAKLGLSKGEFLNEALQQADAALAEARGEHDGH